MNPKKVYKKRETQKFHVFCYLLKTKKLSIKLSLSIGRGGQT